MEHLPKGGGTRLLGIEVADHEVPCDVPRAPKHESTGCTIEVIHGRMAGRLIKDDEESPAVVEAALRDPERGHFRAGSPLGRQTPSLP